MTQESQPNHGSKIGGGGKTGKRVWHRPTVRQLRLVGATRGGPTDTNLFESASYNLNNIDCGRYPDVCRGYNLS